MYIGTTICNDGRDSSAYVEEIGADMVAYCQIDDENGYPAYVAPTPSGDAKMYYEPGIPGDGVSGSGYAIFHEGGIKAYCVNETTPLNCSYKWVTRDFAPDTWFIDTNMKTFLCNQTCEDDDSDING